MDNVILDSAQSEVSNRVKDMVHAIFIDCWKSEPCYQHKNFSERRHQNVKRQTNALLNRTGAPARTCSFAIIHIFLCYTIPAMQLLIACVLMILSVQLVTFHLHVVFTSGNLFV